MSAVLPTTDIRRGEWHVAFVPRTDSCIATNSRKFIGANLIASATGRRWFEMLSGVQLIEQRAGLLQIERVETLGEPAVDRRQQFARLLHLALVAPEPRHAH